MDGKRKLGTDEIVARAMEEEEGRKKQKKGAAAPAQPGNPTILYHTVPAALSLVAIRIKMRPQGKQIRG